MIRTKPTESNLEYFLWLTNKIRLKDHTELRRFIENLSSVPFYSLISFDDNRALDGLQFRDSFKYETLLEPPSGECSVLEVLIGIAERMAYILYDPDLENEDQIHIWFWELIHNLRINKNDNYMENMDKIYLWLNRRYSENGDGGLFPLQNPIENQREVELWHKMQAYLNEKLYNV